MAENGHADGRQRESCIRTTSVKIRDGDPSLLADLNATHAAVSQKAVQFMRFLLAARGEPYWDGKRLVPIEEIVAAQAVYLRGINPVIGAALLRRFYEAAVGTDAAVDDAPTRKGKRRKKNTSLSTPVPDEASDQKAAPSTAPYKIAISYVSPMYKPDSAIGTATRKNFKTGLINPVEPGKALCRELLDAGIFPVVADDLPNGAFQKAAWITAFKAIRSWHEANKAFVKTTRSLENSLAELVERLASVPASVALLGEQFLQAARDSGRRLDRKFAKRWQRAIRKALLTGVGLRQGEAEFFEPFRELWEDRDHVSSLLRIEGLRHRLQGRTATAATPLIDPATIPLLTCVSASNTIPISLASRRGAVVGHVVLINAEDPSTTHRHSFECLPSRYFVDLVLETHAKDKTLVATARYHKGNKDRVPVVAEIKEPRISRRGDSWYIDLIQSVEVRRRDGSPFVDARDAFSQLGYFTGSEKSVASTAIRPGLRVLSIDLNISPPIAFACYEFGQRRANRESLEATGLGWANLIAKGKRGDTGHRQQCGEIRQFRRRLITLQGLIRFRSRLLNGFDPVDAHPRYIDSVLETFKQLGLPYDSNAVALKDVILTRMSTLKATYRDLKMRDTPDRKIGLSVEQFEWAGAIGDYIRMLKTWNHGGLKREDRPSGSIEGECRSYYQYMGNVKKDLVRKLGAEVRRLCNEHSADVVLLEDLEFFRMSVEYEKGTNSLLSLWSPMTILGWIENAIQPHGVCVRKIDPRHTSRIDPATGEFGFYEYRADKRGLVVERKGKFHLLDADIAAADNLQRRFWLRQEEIYRLECYPVGDDIRVVPIIGKRAASYLKSHHGSATGHILHDRFVPTSADEHRRILEAASDGESGDDTEDGTVGRTKYYRHGDSWMKAEDHRLHLNGIFERFAAQASLGAMERAYVDRVKGLPEKDLVRLGLA